jgi:predicted RNA methylase
MKKEGQKAFSSIDFVGQCLVDEQRTKTFQTAIQKAVKRTSAVLDMGSGSGILALFAAKAGAKKVVAVEYDPYVASIAKGNFSLNKVLNKITLVIADARTLTLPKKDRFNVVLSEMLTTGIVDEYQVQSANNLHDKGLVDKSTVFIPQRQDTFVTLVNANLSLFGQKINMVLHLWHWHNWRQLKIKKLSPVALLSSIDFRQKNSERFVKTMVLKIGRTGLVNGLCLTSRAVLDDNTFIGDTEALNAPMLVPIKPVKVQAGHSVKLKIEYVFGGGYGNFYARIVK